MKKFLKQNRGVSLVSLSIAIIILIIITNILVYNAKDGVYIKNLTSMYNDVSNLREKVSNYYATYGEIPAKVKYENTDVIEKMKTAGVIGANDKSNQFYVIDLSAMDGLTLNFGKDYSVVEEMEPITEENQSEVNQLQDFYIINKNSHNIFYVKGITVPNDKTYYTDDKNIDIAKMDLRYVEGVKIPDGFYYCGGTKDEGIVISDVQGDDLENSKQGNQFVWVPVENFSEFVRHDFGKQDIVDSDFIDTTPTNSKYYEPTANGKDNATEAEKMYKSVKEYKGFYIGRYEAGTTATSGTGIRGQVVSKKGANVYNYIGWNNANPMTITAETGGAVEVARGMYPSDNNQFGATSTLCYGVQWDAVMRWISKDSNLSSYLTDSTGKGNYGTSLIIPTGSNEAYQMKHIYDMAGNVEEWTMESKNSYMLTNRGGVYFNSTSSNPVTDRTGNQPADSRDFIGFRITLYLTPEENWSEPYDKTAIYTDENGDKAYIPEGFQVSLSSYENKINDGLVIRNATDKNEFVWVPVSKENFETEFVREHFGTTAQKWWSGTFVNDKPTANSMYEPTPANTTGATSTTAAEVTAMYESVKTHGGFYIARYEAGTTDTDTSKTGIRGQVVSKKGATVYNKIGWSNERNMITETGGAVEVARGMYSGHSTLCYGVQWDAVMRWISKDAALSSYLADSGEKGNYGTSSVIPTGSNEAYQIKNIYDMAGNVWEWTMEANDTYLRIGRGGVFDGSVSDNPVSYRGNIYPDDSNYHLGFRVAFYI